MSRTAAEGLRAELESRGCPGSRDALLDTAWWLVRNGVLSWSQLAGRDVDSFEGGLLAGPLLPNLPVRVACRCLDSAEGMCCLSEAFLCSS